MTKKPSEESKKWSLGFIPTAELKERAELPLPEQSWVGAADATGGEWTVVRGKGMTHEQFVQAIVESRAAAVENRRVHDERVALQKDLEGRKVRLRQLHAKRDAIIDHAMRLIPRGKKRCRSALFAVIDEVVFGDEEPVSLNVAEVARRCADVALERWAIIEQLRHDRLAESRGVCEGCGRILPPKPKAPSLRVIDGGRAKEERSSSRAAKPKPKASKGGRKG
jgi:hypothetical protein